MEVALQRRSKSWEHLSQYGCMMIEWLPPGSRKFSAGYCKVWQLIKSSVFFRAFLIIFVFLFFRILRLIASFPIDLSYLLVKPGNFPVKFANNQPNDYDHYIHHGSPDWRDSHRSGLAPTPLSARGASLPVMWPSVIFQDMSLGFSCPVPCL